MTDKKDQKFVKLTDDILFKETFGREKNIRWIERLLEQYFELRRDSLKGKITVKMETTLEKGKYKDKNSRGDILIYLGNRIINLEAYGIFNKDALDKSVFYSNRISGTSLERGTKYEKLKPFISINIVEKVEGIKLREEVITKYRYRNKETELTEKMEIVIIRLDKLKEIPYTVGENEFLTTLRFIGAETKEERKYYAKEGSKYLMSLEYFLNEFMNDEYCNQMFTMENKIKETGIAEGKLYGKIEGIKEGKKEGKIEIAKDMLIEMPKIGIDKISKITKLPIEEIRKMKEELHLKKKVQEK